MIAVRDFTHRGQAYGLGQYLTVSPLESIALKRRGHARYARAGDTPPPAPAAVVEAPAPKRRYRRRDLQPEP